MRIQLHIDGKPVEFVVGGRGILVMGKTLEGRTAPVADHSVDPKLLTPGSRFFTGGHLYEVKPHPSYYSLD